MTLRLRSQHLGFSLVELVVALGFLSVVMTLGATLLTLMLRSQRSGAASLAESVAVSRLAREFRRDAHAASTARLESDALAFQHGDDTTVTYASVEDGVQRSVRRRQGPVQREIFEFSGADLAFERVAEPLVAMEVDRQTPPAVEQGQGAGPTRKIRVEAHLGRDLRFLHSEDQ